MGHMSLTETKPLWNGSAQDLLNSFLAIEDFRLSNYTISQVLLWEFDQLFAKHKTIPSDRML